MLMKQEAEAIKRMKDLTKKFDLNPNLTKYLEEGRVYYSYTVSGLFGCVDTISYDESYEKIVSEFERMHRAYVYHGVESETAYGKMLALLYVSPYEEDWAAERLTGKYIMAYVYNLDEEFGEIGSIYLASDNGALIRTN